MRENNGIDMIFEMKKSELWEEIQELQREEITRAVENERERFIQAIQNFIKDNFTICGKYVEEKDFIATNAYNECLKDLGKLLIELKKGE